MFQSSRTASGMPLRQASSACSPSSASTIWKSSRSRIRRATLRMTLESSTTKQVFISASLVRRIPACSFPSAAPLTGARNSSRLRARSDIEHPVDVEHHQQPVIEPVYAGRYAGKPRIEVDGIVLALARLQPHHLSDRIDQQAVGFALMLDADRHS